MNSNSSRFANRFFEPAEMALIATFFSGSPQGGGAAVVAWWAGEGTDAAVLSPCCWRVGMKCVEEQSDFVRFRKALEDGSASLEI